MPRPSRFRRVAKWVGLGVCVFLTTAWAVSTIFLFGVRRPIIPRIQAGTADSWLNGKKIATGPPMYWARFDSLYQGQIVINSLASAVNESECTIAGPNAPILTARNFGFVLPYAVLSLAPPSVPARLTLGIPMWLPLVVFAIPTAYFWYRDRRTAKPGNCLHCGCNLTGAEHEKCPECGAGVGERAAGGKHPVA